ncbi:hypothetical protein AMTR_s00136p00083500, partial [Amborella trichopoda]
QLLSASLFLYGSLMQSIKPHSGLLILNLEGSYIGNCDHCSKTWLPPSWVFQAAKQIAGALASALCGHVLATHLDTSHLLSTLMARCLGGRSRRNGRLMFFNSAIGPYCP